MLVGTPSAIVWCGAIYPTHFQRVPSLAHQPGFRIELDSSFRVTKQPTLVYGGVQKYPCRAIETERILVGRVWTDPATLRGTPAWGKEQKHIV